tara:strand:+ start:181 stop:948 length:768 start_codon:yes stop_codon:yes gene_type:complete
MSKFNKEKLTKEIKFFIKRYLKNFDYVYLTSDLRGFIYYYNISPDLICRILFSQLLKEKKTIVVPAFSFVNKGIFNIKKTKSNLGFLTKWALKNLKYRRSEHPVFSVIAVGKDKQIVEKIGKSAFGYESIFYRLYNNKTSLLHFGRPFNLGNTVIHFVEQITGAFYRENKLIQTRVYSGRKYIGGNYSIFARKGKIHSSKYISNTKKIDKYIKKNNLITQIGNEKYLTNISHLNMRDCVDFMCKKYYHDNKIFIN